MIGQVSCHWSSIRNVFDSRTHLQPKRIRFRRAGERRVEFSFTVFGVAQPQGSTRAFIPRGWTRAVITTDNAKLKPWRQELTQTAMVAMRECGAQIAARGVPISISLSF